MEKEKWGSISCLPWDILWGKVSVCHRGAIPEKKDPFYFALFHSWITFTPISVSYSTLSGGFHCTHTLLFITF